MAEELDGVDEASVLAPLLPRKLQHYFFGDGAYTKEVAVEVSKTRGYNITCYVISSNDDQAACIFRLLESIPSRVFQMKGEDFYSVAEGRYDTMGIDRCACVKGSSTIFGFPTLVIDGGSAITYTGVDSYGRIMGGGISPGIKMRLKAMNEGTGALPFIQTEDILKYVRKAMDNKVPLSTFANNTEEAMVNSTLNEIAAHLRNVMKIWTEKIESSKGTSETDIQEVDLIKTVAVTGGSGEIIAKLLQPNSAGIVESVHDVSRKYVVTWEKTLLHIGVAAALLGYVKKSYKESNDKNEDKKQAQIAHIHRSLVGKRIAKYFNQATDDNNHIYRGTVKQMHQASDGLLFHVSYDDRDGEMVHLEELKEMMTKYELVGEKESDGKKKTSSIQRESFMGRKIAKRFDDGIVYFGAVIDFNDEYWRVRYEDNDEEEFDIDELTRYLKFYEEQQKEK